MQSVRHFLLAIQFFTRIPVTGRLAQWVGYSPEMLRASSAHFPAVGWVVGGLTALVFALLMHLLPPLPASAWLAAVLSTVFSVWLTGAFHEDGLSDTVDGLGGGLTRELAEEISYLSGIKPMTGAKIFTDPGGVRYSLACVAAILPACGALLMILGSRRAPAAVAEYATWGTAQERH